MRPPQTTKRTWILIGSAVCPLLVLALVFAVTLMGLLPWSSLNCWHQDVDIQSGRIKQTRYLFWIQVRETISDSAITMALSDDDLREKPCDWKRSLTFSPAVRNSPHYAYHSAIHQIHELEQIWGIGSFTPEARRTSANRMLALWQETPGDAAAQGYLQSLGKWTSGSSEDSLSIGETDLPRLGHANP